MSDVNLAKASPTPQHLIFEYHSNEGLASVFLPSLKARGLNLGGLRHVQVMRYVYTLMAMEDVYFEGRKLPDMPGVGHILTEWVKPGRQIVSVPNGRVAVSLAYYGKKNIAQAHAAQRTLASAAAPFLTLYGADPASGRMLYGNPSVTFSQRGDEPAFAAAYYNSASRRFEPVQNPSRSTLLENFMRRFGRETALAG